MCALLRSASCERCGGDRSAKERRRAHAKKVRIYLAQHTFFFLSFFLPVLRQPHFTAIMKVCHARRQREAHDVLAARRRRAAVFSLLCSLSSRFH